MALLGVQSVDRVAGLTPVYGAAAGAGDKFQNDGNVMLHIKVGATVTNITIASPNLCSQGGTHPIPLNGLASTERMLGPFSPKQFNAGDGTVGITYSQVVGVTVAVIALPES